MGHYSPLVSEDDVEIKEGDIVKIDMGVHVDGYIAVVAHTLAQMYVYLMRLVTIGQVCGRGAPRCHGRS